jgi:hypothetical protein
MTLRGVIVAKNVHGSNDLYAWSIGRYQNDGLLEMWILVVWVMLPHNNVDLAAGVSSSRYIPFVTINNNFVTFLPNGRLDIGCIRGGN